MKINEVEAAVGVTKKNIRFYEEKGLIAPRRNSENGYREYGTGEVEQLKQIKLLRKLGVPLEEIRRMQQGALTLTDGLRRHMIQLERQQQNLATMQRLCQELADAGAQLPGLEADDWLGRMERMEQEGTRFVNIRKKDTMARYLGPVIAALVFVGLMGLTIAFLVWACTVDPVDRPPRGLLIFLIAAPMVVIVGVVLALIQRIKQIQGGEEDAASQY